MAHLTLEQRYKIESYRNLGKPLSEIADYIGKDKSVVCREIKRNADGRSGLYKAGLAQRKTESRHRSKRKNIRFNETVKERVLHGLNRDYSPEQIAGRAKAEQVEMVSHERIYQFVWQDKRQGGKLYQHLRTKGKNYRKRAHRKDKRGLITNRIGIEKTQIIDQKDRVATLKWIWS